MNTIIFFFTFILLLNGQKMDICYITIKNYDTRGNVPTDAQRAGDGVMVETFVNDQWCYEYFSKKYPGVYECTEDRRYNWYGTDDMGSIGVKIIESEEGMSLDELKQKAKFITLPSGDTKFDENIHLDWTLFDEYRTDDEGSHKIKFYAFGTHIKTMRTSEEENVFFIRMETDDGSGRTGDMAYGYFFNDPNKGKTIKIKYSIETTHILGGIRSQTNFNVLDVFEQTLIVGHPKSRNDNVTDLSKNIMIQSIIDLDEEETAQNDGYPIAIEETKFIPSPSDSLYHLGASVQISKNYLCISDPNSNRGIVYVVRRNYDENGEETLKYVATINPFPRWGNFQQFGSIIRSTEELDSQGKETGKTLLYVAAPNAWIHNNRRLAEAAGMEYTEGIGVVYEFELTVGQGCVPKNYYIYKNPKIVNGKMDSTINKMVEIDGRVYVTIKDVDGLYQVECDEKFTLHL